MNRLGIMIDISHASEGTFWDVIKYSTQPIIASHSSSKALCEHDRNLTDEQIRALAKNGGVAQLCPVSYTHLFKNAYERDVLPRNSSLQSSDIDKKDQNVDVYKRQGYGWYHHLPGIRTTWHRR